MSAGGRVKRAWLAIIKLTLNHVTVRVARSSHGPFTMVRHVGRKSGTTYETPIISQPQQGAFIIELTYGPEVNWYRNVEAAGGCTLVRQRISYRIDRIEPVSAEEGLALFREPQRTVLRLLRRRDFRRFVVVGS